MITPYLQGNFSAECGVYSTINAIQYFNEEFSEETENDLYKIIVKSYRDYTDILLNGIEKVPLKKLINVVRRSKLRHLVKNLEITRPKLSSDVKTAFEEIELAFSENDMLVYLGITDSVLGGHWTLIKNVDSDRVHFHDSVGLKTRKIKNLEFTDRSDPIIQKNKTLIYPKEIFYINMKKTG